MTQGRLSTKEGSDELLARAIDHSQVCSSENIFALKYARYKIKFESLTSFTPVLEIMKMRLWRRKKYPTDIEETRVISHQFLLDGTLNSFKVFKKQTFAPSIEIQFKFIETLNSYIATCYSTREKKHPGYTT